MQSHDLSAYIEKIQEQRDQYKAALQNIVMVYTLPNPPISLEDAIEAGKRALMEFAGTNDTRPTLKE